MNNESSSSQVRPLCHRGFTCKWLRPEEGKLGGERENALSPPEVCSKENKINFTITFRRNVLIYLTDESLTSLGHFKTEFLKSCRNVCSKCFLMFQTCLLCLNLRIESISVKNIYYIIFKIFFIFQIATIFI